MKCPEFDAALHQFFIGELDPARKKDLDMHAESCTRCRDLMRTAYELTCKKFVEFLGDYADDVLAPDRKAVFERHLAICPECTAYLQAYRKTIHLTGNALTESPEEMVKSMPDDLVRAIVSSLKKK